ncbi:MAG: RraA family protein [Actinobacteria bacterium]|nr:RraA family protein [Actinomycetota bacterium]
MSSRIASIWEGGRASGRAFTVSTPPGDNASLHEAIEVIGQGEVLVVDGKEYLDRALWGAIMSEAAQLKGVVGLVVDGAVRDVSETRRLRFPIFAAGRTPAGPYNKVRGSLGDSIMCGGVWVNPGDWVHADDDGVVVIPEAATEDVLALAQTRHELEDEILTGLRDGKVLSSLLGILRRGKGTPTS